MTENIFSKRRLQYRGWVVGLPRLEQCSGLRQIETVRIVHCIVLPVNETEIQRQIRSLTVNTRTKMKNPFQNRVFLQAR